MFNQGAKAMNRPRILLSVSAMDEAFAALYSALQQRAEVATAKKLNCMLRTRLPTKRVLTRGCNRGKTPLTNKFPHRERRDRRYPRRYQVHIAKGRSENILSRRVTEKESKPLRFTLFFFTAYAGKAVCSCAWGHCLTRYLLNIRVFIIIEN